MCPIKFKYNLVMMIFGEVRILLPIDPLMSEHRLIERVIKQVNEELHDIRETNNVNSNFIDVATDFLGTYSDRCHESKEEVISFRDLAKKNLPYHLRQKCSTMTEPQPSKN